MGPDEIEAAITDEVAVVMLTHIKLPHRAHVRHGCRHRQGPWCRRADAVGPRPFRRRGPRSISMVPAPIWRSAAAINT